MAEIGAHIGMALELHREEAALFHRGRAQLRVRWRGHCVSETKLSRTGIGPLHGTTERAGSVEQTHIFGIDRRFHAEGAADMAGANAQLVGLDAQDLLGQQRCACPNTPWLPICNGPAARSRHHVSAIRRTRLHRCDNDPVGDDRQYRVDSVPPRQRPSPRRHHRHSGNRGRGYSARRRKVGAQSAAMALVGSVTASSGSISTSTISTASRACSADCAMTMATGSPI